MTVSQTGNVEHGAPHPAPPSPTAPAAASGGDRTAALAAAAAELRRYRELQQQALASARRLGTLFAETPDADAQFRAWRRAQHIRLVEVRRLVRLIQPRPPRVDRPGPGLIERLARHLADRRRPGRAPATNLAPKITEVPAPLAAATGARPEAKPAELAPAASTARPGFCLCGRPLPKLSTPPLEPASSPREQGGQPGARPLPIVELRPAPPSGAAEGPADPRPPTPADQEETPATLPIFTLVGNRLTLNLTYREAEVFRRTVLVPRRIPDLREFLLGALIFVMPPAQRELFHRFWRHPEAQFQPGYRGGTPGAELYPELARAGPT